MQSTTTYTAITGSVIARLRRIAGLQQAVLAAQVGVNQSSWSKIERGETAISVEYLALLESSLGVKPGGVLTEADRVTAYAEAQGVRVFRQRSDLVAEALHGQLSGRALTGLMEAALKATEGPAQG